MVAGEVVYSPDAVFENIVEEITTTEESTTSTTTTTTTEISTTTTEEPTTTTKAPEPDLYDVSIKKVDQHGNAVEGVTFELYQIIQTMVEATSDSSVVTGEPVSVDTSVIDMEIETLSTQIGELKKQIATLEAEQETTIQSEASESLDSDRLITIESLNAQIVALEDQLEEKLTEKSAITINTTEELAEKVEEVKVGTYTTDKSGLIQVSGLVEGEYYFVETAAPVGYDFTNKPYYFSLPKDKSLLFTITNLNNNTTTVEDTTTTLEDTTTSEITTTVEDTTTSEITTTVEDTTTSEITTTVEDTTTSEITTTAEDTTTSEITTTVGDTTTSESTTTVEYFTTAEDTTTTEETPVPSGETTVSGGTPGDNDSTPNKGQDNNKHLPHTGESIMSQIVLPTIGFSLLAGGFLIFSLKNGYKL